jgi:hypothetical protein
MTVCTSRVVARSLLWTALIVLPAVAGACRDSGGGNDDADASQPRFDANPADPDASPPPDADPSVPDANLTLPDGMPTQPSNPDDVTVYEVQGDLAEDVLIALKGVVITAIDEFPEQAGRVGSFWIQEPAGGAYSGVQVFGASLTDVEALSVGDIVDVGGVVKDEFVLLDNGQPNPDFGPPLTELKNASRGSITITKTGTQAPPAPVVIDALAISRLPTLERNYELEKWEGVLVKVENAEVLTTPRKISNQENFREFRIRGILLDSSIGAIPVPEITIGRCLSSVTGVMSYFFNYKILPRPGDIVLTAGTCQEVEEDTAAECATGFDDDGDSFADCDDASCWIDTRTCALLSQIATIQAGTVAVNTKVAIHDVFVTGISPDRTHLWVSTSPAAAASNGLYVFRTNSAPLKDQFVIGAKVRIAGRVKEFDVTTPVAGDTLTQFELGSASFVSAPAETLVPVSTATPATLSSLVDGEPFESVLVKVDHLRVTAHGTFDKVTLANDAGQVIVMDDGAFNYDLQIPDPANPNARIPNPEFAVGTCFTSVTGIMSVELTDNVRTLNPTSAAALVRGKGCVVPPVPPTP